MASGMACLLFVQIYVHVASLSRVAILKNYLAPHLFIGFKSGLGGQILSRLVLKRLLWLFTYALAPCPSSAIRFLIVIVGDSL